MSDLVELPPTPTRDDELRAAVLKVVRELQRRQLGDIHDSSVTARLARLRRAVTAEPGSLPEIWSDTVGGLPDSLAWGSEPTPYEWAAHESVTLYALHQQSKSTAMNRDGVTLGTAARKLVVANRNEGAIRSRFQAIATAGTAAGVAHHLRSLVTLLRSGDIALDYGQLAVDLRRLRDPRSADRVRLRWGRDFSRISSEDPDETTDDA